MNPAHASVIADAGAIACAALDDSTGSAEVIAVFRRAIYVRLPGNQLVALTDRTVPRGPLHVRMAVLPSVRRGQLIQLGAGAVLGIGDLTIEVRSPGWTGSQPTGSDLCGAYEVARLLPGDLPLPAPLDRSGCVAGADAAVARGDLLALAGLLGGLGPGLTPAGDDVLAGVLFVAALAADDARRGVLTRVVPAARTNDIAAAFLTCAALGQSIEPAHELVDTLAQRDLGRAVQAHGRLVRFGASSGQALAYGIVLALRSLPCLATGRSHEYGKLMRSSSAVVRPPFVHVTSRSAM